MSSTSVKEKVKIDKSVDKTYQYLKERLDIGTNYDVVLRKYKIGNRYIHAYFVNGLADEEMMSRILRQISFVDKPLSNFAAFQQLLDESLINMQVTVTDNMDEAVDELLTGLMVIFGDTWGKAFIIDVRAYPGRTPEEPDTERVVRGSRDGFTESIVMNTGLVRRRIRDERLRMEMQQVGERSKTDICIAYIKDIANPDLIQEIKDRLNEIEIDGIPMTDKAIGEFVVNQGYNPFPKVRFTERPDVVAAHLYEGHAVIMVDTSPSVIILPTTYFNHIQHAEEFRHTPMVGMFIRLIRFVGIFVSLFLPPLWLLFAMQSELIPDFISFIGPSKDDYNIPIFLQFLFAELGIDLMRLAAIHTSTPLAVAMGLIAAVLIGEIAIQVGFFLPEVILYIAIASIGTFATPSYELSLANKFFRYVILFAVFFFKVSGFVVTCTVFMIYLTMMKSVRAPYMWPLIPFNLKAFLSVVLRFTSGMTKTRPSFVHPQNKTRQSRSKQG